MSAPDYSGGGFGGYPPQNGAGGYPPPQQGYPPTQQGYGAPDPGYGASPQGYGAPAPSYGSPPQDFGAPPQGYGATPQGTGAPPIEQQPGQGIPMQEFSDQVYYITWMHDITFTIESKILSKEYSYILF
jgi:hypothetical protein